MHWHAFAWTGPGRPSDGAARDETQAVPPNEIAMFFRKPPSMLAGTYADAAGAYEWLAAELEDNPPRETDLPVARHLAAALDGLDRRADVYTGYYTASGGFLVRALLVCPRAGERCPRPPAGPVAGER